ncbi:MAG: hypothetical protein AAGG48_32015 [Planctomycetota bacterium]
MTKRTFASVTTTPCTCNYLQDAADHRDSPIHFDANNAEYHFTFDDHKLIIYHCPFCGGAAPESKRDKLFADIPFDEQSRLAKLLEPIDSIDAAIDALGKPDYDGFVNGKHRDADGDSPRLSRQRTIRYERLSDTAQVWVTEIPGGKAHWQLQGKYVG